MKRSLILCALLCLSPVARASDAGQIFRDSIKSYEKGDYDKALKGFVRVMRLDPGNAEAREYMLRCSQKIVEYKLGSQAADTIEKQIGVEKQIQETSPDAPPALSEDMLRPVKPAAQSPAASSPGASGGGGSTARDQDIRDAAAALPSNARDLLSERGALTDDLRRRLLGKGNIVNVDDGGGRLGVTFYLNRLFMPLSDTLRPDAYSILDDICRLIADRPKRTVTLTSVDNVSPAVRHTMADLSARRTSVVFSYLLYTTYVPKDN